MSQYKTGNENQSDSFLKISAYTCKPTPKAGSLSNNMQHFNLSCSLGWPCCLQVGRPKPAAFKITEYKVLNERSLQINDIVVCLEDNCSL